MQSIQHETTELEPVNRIGNPAAARGCGAGVCGADGALFVTGVVTGVVRQTGPSDCRQVLPGVVYRVAETGTNQPDRSRGGSGLQRWPAVYHHEHPCQSLRYSGQLCFAARLHSYACQERAVQDPFVGQAMAAAEFPSIDRSNRQNAVRDLDRARAMMESGIVLWAAPEGTRSPDGNLLPFKKGCFHLALDTEAVIVPVAIRGIHRVLPARSMQINLGQPVDVRVGTPIDTAGKSKEDLAGVMEEVRQRLEELLGDGEAG